MLTFASPLYLWGLCALAIPVALHLLQLREAKRQIVFPSVRHLRVTRQPQDGKRRLRHLLLLLLRLAILAAVCLMLAEPHYVPDARGREQEQEARRIAIVLDASASMATGKRYERARKKVEQLLDQYLPGVQVGLVVTGAASSVSQHPTHERWKLEEALATLEPSYATGEPGSALRQALAWLAGSATPELHLVSDFQATDWERRWQLLPPKVNVTLHDVTVDGEGQGNCGIADVQCIRVGERRVRIQVAVYSNSPREETRTLTVRAGGISQTQRLALPPNGRLRPVLVLDGVPPEQEGEATLSADDYARDDSFSFWADGPPPRHVVIAVASDQQQASAQEAAFVHTALVSVGEGSMSRFAVTTRDVELLVPEDVKQADVLILPRSVSRLQTNMDEPVRSLLSRGGLVLATLGDEPIEDVQCLRHLGLQFGEFRGQSGRGHDGLVDDGIAKVAPESVLSSLFAQTTDSDLYRFSIRKHSRMRAASSSFVHLQGLSGDPLLIEAEAGRGRGFLLTFGLTPGVSDFQLTSSFLPLLQELLWASLPQDAGLRRLVCGQQAEDVAGVLIDTRRPGLFLDGSTHVEINADPQEASQRRVSEAEMRELLYTERERGISSYRDATRAEHDWTRLVAVILLVVVLLEQVFAMLSDRSRHHAEEPSAT